MTKPAVGGGEKPTYRLTVFEGPLDLLLHLIGKNKVSICDISISEITGQYFEYLDRMRRVDLEITAEFITMAAHLLLIKSRHLLPVEEEPDGIDPVEELKRALEEYAKIKKAAGLLAGAQFSFKESYLRSPELLDVKRERGNEEIGADRLFEAFLAVLERNLMKRPLSASAFEGIGRAEAVSLKTCMKSVIKRVSGKGADFFSLFEGAGTRDVIVVTFLAILELIRMGRIIVKERKNKLMIIGVEK